MKIIADYHTHTIYSHGMGTIEDNVKSAIKKGLEIIAISDHGPGYLEYGINKLDYKKMRETIDRLNEKYFGTIHILLGIEANIMDEEGNLDIDDEILKYNDIVLGGFHFDIVYKELLSDIRLNMKRHENLKSKMDESLYEEIKEMNTQAMVNAIKKYDIDILTHPGDKQPIDIVRVSKAIQETDTSLEINNFHRHLNVSQIKKAMTFEKVKFVISSDAHRPKDVGNFSGALKLLNKSGLNMERVKNVRPNKICI